MRDYGKVHTAFWASEALRELDADGKLLALYLLTSPHTTMIGAFRLPDAYACEDLGWSTERLRNGFATLSESGFVQYDARTKWVWIVNFLGFNKPENPNQWKAATKLADAIPASVSFKEAVCETVRKPFLNTPVPAPAPVPTPEARSDDTPDCPHEQIIALYHELLPTGARVRQWTDTSGPCLAADVGSPASSTPTIQLDSGGAARRFPTASRSHSVSHAIRSFTATGRHGKRSTATSGCTPPIRGSRRLGTAFGTWTRNARGR